MEVVAVKNTMKKILALGAAFLLAACMSGIAGAAEKKYLIAYFTRVGNTDLPAGIDAQSSASLNARGGKLVGNTELIAEMIARETGGDLFRITTQKKYAADYDEVVNYARREPKEDRRPVLSSHVENMKDYDVVFIGYPIWWYTMPMAVYTFVEEYDLSGKTIVPFCTHGGSRLSGTVEELQRLLPKSTVLSGFEVYGERAADAEADVKAWIKNLGLAE
jgi:flavodoxin